MDKGLRIVSKEQMLTQIRGEYVEMPGLRLTLPQARRLWGLDERTCVQLLESLVDASFLRRTVDGKYARLAEGPLLAPPLRMAEAGVDSKVSTRAGDKPRAA